MRNCRATAACRRSATAASVTLSGPRFAQPAVATTTLAEQQHHQRR
ncbi:hypothetical protein ACFXPQ_32965 [Streptomyces lydicus]